MSPSPASMPGAQAAKRRRRVLVEYEGITGQQSSRIIGRLLVNAETPSVYVRHGFIDIRCEYPIINDMSIPARPIIDVTFINPDVEISDLLEPCGFPTSKEVPW